MNSIEKKCDICKRPSSAHIPKSGLDTLCNSCKDIIDINKTKKGYGSIRVKNALRRAVRFDEKSKEFISFNCFYSDIPCDVKYGFKENSNSLSNAFDLTFDHKNPTDKKSDELVVCLQLINQMKSNIPSDNFKELIKVLAKRFEEQIDPSTLKEEIKRIIIDIKK
jgi:hypothetical protein